MLEDKETSIMRKVRLPENAYKLLVSGDPTRDSFSLASSIVHSAANVGMSVESIFALMRNPSNAGGEIVRTWNSERALAFLDRIYKTALSSKNSHQVDLVNELSPCLEKIPYLEKLSLSERKILTAHYMIAMKVGNRRYVASQRGLAEMANVNKRTAANANKSLHKKGFFKEFHPKSGKFFLNTRFVLNYPTTDPSPLGDESGAFGTTNILLHPISQHGSGVNPLILGVMQPGREVTNKDICKETGSSPSTVSRILRRHEKLGLCERVEGTRRWMSTNSAAQISVIVEEDGLDARVQKRKARHREERRERQRFLIHKFHSACLRISPETTVVRIDPEKVRGINLLTGEVEATFYLPRGGERFQPYDLVGSAHPPRIAS